MGTGAWGNFYEDGTVRHFFLFVFCQHGDGSMEVGRVAIFFLFVITHNLLSLPKIFLSHCRHPSLLLVAVSANFFHLLMETLGREHGNGSAGIFLWRWDSDAYFHFCLLSTCGWQHGDRTVWQFFCLLPSLIICHRCLKKISSHCHHPSLFLVAVSAIFFTC